MREEGGGRAFQSEPRRSACICVCMFARTYVRTYVCGTYLPDGARRSGGVDRGGDIVEESHSTQSADFCWKV